jgi:hypothetical protein
VFDVYRKMSGSNLRIFWGGGDVALTPINLRLSTCKLQLQDFCISLNLYPVTACYISLNVETASVGLSAFF